MDNRKLLWQEHLCTREGGERQNLSMRTVGRWEGSQMQHRSCWSSFVHQLSLFSLSNWPCDTESNVRDIEAQNLVVPLVPLPEWLWQDGRLVWYGLVWFGMACPSILFCSLILAHIWQQACAAPAASLCESSVLAGGDWLFSWVAFCRMSLQDHQSLFKGNAGSGDAARQLSAYWVCP